MKPTFTATRNRIYELALIGILLLLTYFILFLHLGNVKLAPYDEACYALNAAEMVDNGDLITVHLLGRTERYNTKPPFGIWCMAASIALFGMNEISVRLAAALFAVMTVLLLFTFCKKQFRSVESAIFPCVILLTGAGYVNWHITRTGDLDSILAFWVCFYAIHFFNYLEHPHPKFIYMTAGGLAFACMTKGIAGLTALPALVLWAIFSGQMKTMLRSWHFYLALMMFMAIVPGYYVLREIRDPGYWDAVISNEIGGRLARQPLLNVREVPFWYYLDAFIEEKRFLPWIFIVPLSCILTILSPDTRLKKCCMYFTACSASVLLLLCLSKTKFEWYDAPLYPLLSLLCGIGFHQVMLSGSMLRNKLGTQLAFIFLAFHPTLKIISLNLSDDKTYIRPLPDFLEQIRKHHCTSDTIYIINMDADFSIYFYALKDKKNGLETIVTDAFHTTFKPGDLLIPSKKERLLDITSMYKIDVLKEEAGLAFVRIAGKY